MTILRKWFSPTEPNGNTRKPVHAITPADAAAFPIWEYATDEESLPGRDETWVRPILQFPVASLSNRIALVPIRLANGQTRLGALSNVDLADPSEHEHFLTLGVYCDDGTQFVLARYHDHHREEYGPQALADFLGLPLDDVFPIAFDLSAVAFGNPSCLRGTIEREPKHPQSRRDLFRRVVGRERG